MQKFGLVCGLVIVMLVRLVVNLVDCGGKFKRDKNSKFEKSETYVSCKIWFKLAGDELTN